MAIHDKITEVNLVTHLHQDHDYYYTVIIKWNFFDLGSKRTRTKPLGRLMRKLFGDNTGEWRSYYDKVFDITYVSFKDPTDASLIYLALAQR